MTDGDIRRGLLNNFQLDDYIKKIIQPAPRYIRQGEDNIHKIIQYRENGYRILPVLDIDNKVINVINFRNLKSFIPIDVVIMDLTIPGGMGGKETAERILALDPEAKLIVSSGYSHDPIMANYRKFGFQNFLSKPYQLSELQKVLKPMFPKIID